MKQFSGFPSKTQYTPVPNLFFSSLLSQITDIFELKTTLHLFRILYFKKGYPRCVSYRELLADKSLMDSLKDEEREPRDILTSALEMVAERGTVLHARVVRDGKPEDIYLLNTDSDRRVVDKIKNGELANAGLLAINHHGEEAGTASPPDIFALYEENIGMLTPMIADELREAEKLYPENWIRDAVREAVSLNRRSWRYIERILENWAAEGRKDGTYRRNSKTGPDKFSRQKYDHMVQR